jgi:Protein of unknown function (DUF4239)
VGADRQSRPQTGFNASPHAHRARLEEDGMDWTFTLAAMPLWVSGFLMVGVSVLAAVGGHLYVRKTVGLERLIVNNEVAGFKYATLGVLYAVVLAFAVLTVWEEFRDAEAHVEHEAGALVGLHRLASGFSEPARGEVQQDLRRYAEAVVTEEWDTMARGAASPTAMAALAALVSRYMALDPAGSREPALYGASLDLLAGLGAERRERLDRADGAIPGIMWGVLVVGAIMVIGFTYFFGAPNAIAQMTMTGLLTGMTFLLIFLTVALNHPFTGAVSVGPEPLEHALGVMAAEGQLRPGEDGAPASSPMARADPR